MSPGNLLDRQARLNYCGGDLVQTFSADLLWSDELGGYAIEVLLQVGPKFYHVPISCVTNSVDDALAFAENLNASWRRVIKKELEAK